MMKKNKTFIYVCGASMILAGLICMNISWMVFLLILGAIIFKVDYPIFSLTHVSLIGTPLELFVGSIITIVGGYVITGFASRYES